MPIDHIAIPLLQPVYYDFFFFFLLRVFLFNEKREYVKLIMIKNKMITMETDNLEENIQS